MTITAGDPEPLGASYDGKGVNFTLFSQHAGRVELCLFDEQGAEQRLDLPGRSGDLWHGYVPALKPGQRYGYRVHGPWAPQQGHRFNPAKLLVDPAPAQLRAMYRMTRCFMAARRSPIRMTTRRLRRSHG